MDSLFRSLSRFMFKLFLPRKSLFNAGLALKTALPSR
jgi:hypothetical protein